mmetsp:Transcript_55629/g.120126  ORF Transcript_55629/g.120126 Transcript_55629/m.120126 type:complete len:767 (+) Transcript_55629:108-2408(+)
MHLNIFYRAAYLLLAALTTSSGQVEVATALHDSEGALDEGAPKILHLGARHKVFRHLRPPADVPREEQKRPAPAAGIAPSRPLQYAVSKDVTLITDNLKLLPSGQDIWNESLAWVNIPRVHPSGVVSNIHMGEVRWENVAYMSLTTTLTLTMAAYPASLIALFVSCAFLIGLVMWQLVGSDHHLAAELLNREDVDGFDLVTALECMPSGCRKAYDVWVLICRAIPMMMVFGLPSFLAVCSYPHPQEVFMLMKLLTAACMFTHSIYIPIFSTAGILSMRRAAATDYLELTKKALGDGPIPEVRHVVVLTQYLEDIDVVSMALTSVSRSRIAQSSICVLLAMEDREPEARTKAAALEIMFAGKFRGIFSTFHPADLPNDPPGKASNMAWAFKTLLKHAGSEGWNMDQVVITVADADSEFHHGYFEGLSHHFLMEDAQKRHLRLWQSPVVHMKNYHRQPSPIVVGTMFTAMFELASLADPNAVRVPYSTYSLSMKLATRVGGWDADWIAEDWHMGIKCFLFTLGQASVQPIMLPTVNYTPEEATWFGTIMARWTQAKRHALGFSDLSYYFMMLPLVLTKVLCEDRACRRSDTARRLRDTWYMVLCGVSVVIKIVNVHVILGLTTTYGLLTIVLHEVMNLLFSADRLVDHLFDRTEFCPLALVLGCSICSLTISMSFVGVYKFLGHRIEGKDNCSAIFGSDVLHWLYLVASLQVTGPAFFLALSLATWRAAWSILFSGSFKYEVASKPTKEMRMGDDCPSLPPCWPERKL